MDDTRRRLIDERKKIEELLRAQKVLNITQSDLGSSAFSTRGMGKVLNITHRRLGF